MYKEKRISQIEYFQSKRSEGTKLKEEEQKKGIIKKKKEKKTSKFDYSPFI